MLTTILLGGITHHYMGSNLPFCNRINDVGTITNPYIVAMRGTSEFKAGMILGTDSACGFIAGPISSLRITNNLDFILGAYNTNFKEFNDLGIRPATVWGVTPVFGLDYKIKLSDRVSLDNLISIGIISHAISVSF